MSTVFLGSVNMDPCLSSIFYLNQCLCYTTVDNFIKHVSQVYHTRLRRKTPIHTVAKVVLVVVVQACQKFMVNIRGGNSVGSVPVMPSYTRVYPINSSLP